VPQPLARREILVELHLREPRGARVGAPDLLPLRDDEQRQTREAEELEGPTPTR